MKNHQNRRAFGCRQCDLDFDLKTDLVTHCNNDHNGVVLLQECDEQANIVITQDFTDSKDNSMDIDETTLIEYIVKDDNMTSATSATTVEGDESVQVIDSTPAATEYTVVNISDVAAYQNTHTTVVQDDHPGGQGCKIVQNEDGTTTLVMPSAAGENIGQIDGKTVLLVRLPDDQ